MSKIITFVILLLAITSFAAASEITVGFENLEGVCGQNFTGCDAQTANPYQTAGIQFVNGYITNNTYPFVYEQNTYNTIFPLGSYYLDISGGQQNQNPATWIFTSRFDNTPRIIHSVSFLVLGKNGDAITGARGGVNEQNGYVRNCADPAACPGWLSGFDVVAYDVDQIRFIDSVEAVSYGQAGYGTFGNDFANVRVTITSAQGFDRLGFFQNPAWYNNNPLWGVIAIDQITFEEAPVPEPGTFAVAGLAFLGLAAWRRRLNTTA